MPLRVELASNERVLISNAWIRNVGSLKIDFIVETRTKLLRGKYLIGEDEADTLCKRLHLALERMYLADERSVHQHRDAAAALAETVARTVPGAGPFLAAIDQQIDAGDLYRALKHSRDLVDLEATLPPGPAPSPPSHAPPSDAAPCPAT